VTTGRSAADRHQRGAAREGGRRVARKTRPLSSFVSGAGISLLIEPPAPGPARGDDDLPRRRCCGSNDRAKMLLIFVIAITVLSVSIGLLLNWMWSATFTAEDEPEPRYNPRDLDDPEQRREFERRYPPTKRS
jgi:hypothetical protein